MAWEGLRRQELREEERWTGTERCREEIRKLQPGEEDKEAARMTVKNLSRGGGIFPPPARG